MSVQGDSTYKTQMYGRSCEMLFGAPMIETW